MKATRTRSGADRVEDCLDLYDFDLPEDRIAQTPAMRRDASRLMFLHASDAPSHHVFSDLPELLREGDFIVRNDTKVIPARLRGKRPGGGKAELLLVHRLEPDAGERWLCLGRPASHMKPGKVISVAEGALQVHVEERQSAGRLVVRFPGLSHEELLSRLNAVGETPLPPYIRRDADGPDAVDRERYQTTYARHAGAVAAPTAGLHFTPEIEKRLLARNIDIAHLTLHVGPGTFRPIKVDSLSDHIMDAEYYSIDEGVATRITTARGAGRRIIAVGTTSTRVLETVTGENGVTHAGQGWTEIFIRPGHVFHGIDGLITNFHLPRSSLVVLVSALAGRKRILAAYAEAIEKGYRFYSYGDAMLLVP